MHTIRLGVVATSRKENERRLPIHPAHVASIDPAVRDQLYLERGYGERFGFSDEQLAPYVAGLLPRHELFARCEAVLLFKPLLQDFLDLREGQILWGCPHFVQDEKVTQASIDNRLSVIALEGMLLWPDPNGYPVSICPQMGEMAGYCSVQHALTLVGRTGAFGRPLSAAVIGYGATGRGAVASLRAQGIADITLITRRPAGQVEAPPGVARTAQLTAGLDAVTADGPVPLARLLADHDVVVNCVRQDTNAPRVFLTEADIPALRPGTLVVDVSCDYGMGFSWARPTSFAEPLRGLDNNVRYYAVNHSPSYLWDSATWVLSEAVLPYLGTVLAGEAAWDADRTVRDAVEVRHGIVTNPDILAFQHRDAEYPHAVR
ncbi:alanine dehydrogenase [Kutzneria sp. NPDC052558]|uniref:alanine dehydrogenase n=1 Tax=Kutzneria sp. NPDC052558 TaxID=3364121 RepID=UPI0037C8A783